MRTTNCEIIRFQNKYENKKKGELHFTFLFLQVTKERLKKKNCFDILKLQGGMCVKIEIIQNENITETEITIKAKVLDEELAEIIACLSLIGNTVAGARDGVVSFIPLREILYFESVDNKTFFYTKDEMYETKAKLYELSEKLSDTSFVRISKSTIANLKKLKSIKRAKGSRLEADLVNGEKLVVSRQYVNDIKNKLGV